MPRTDLPTALVVVMAMAFLTPALASIEDASAQRVRPVRVANPSSAPVKMPSKAARAGTAKAGTLTPGATAQHGRASTTPRLSGVPAARDLLTTAGIGKRTIDSVVLHIGLGMPSPASKSNPEDYLLARNQYVTSYNRSRKGPNWVSWHVSAADLGRGPRRNKYRTDRTIPQSWGRASKVDYKGSGYTRGHMVASGERQASRRANSKTFVFTNMLPQVAENNSGPWLHLEHYYGDQVAKHGKDVYIMAGGLYEGAAQTIGINHVAVPSATWKVAVIVDKGTDPAKVTESARVIAIIVPNDASKVKSAQPYTDFRVTPREIEKRSGLKFFTHLPDTVREALRNKLDDTLAP